MYFIYNPAQSSLKSMSEHRMLAPNFGLALCHFGTKYQTYLSIVERNSGYKMKKKSKDVFSWLFILEITQRLSMCILQPIRAIFHTWVRNSYVNRECVCMSIIRKHDTTSCDLAFLFLHMAVCLFFHMVLTCAD